MAFTFENATSRTRPESLASKFLRLYWDGSLPVDPVRIAQAAGVVVYGRGGPTDPHYEFSGFYRRFNGQPSIEFNITEAPVRQRFTIAHELGHFALGHEDSPRDSGDFQSSGDPRERQANQFAAELLMPANEVRNMFLSGVMGSTERLASAFGVSKAALGYRLINLGLV